MIPDAADRRPGRAMGWCGGRGGLIGLGAAQVGVDPNDPDVENRCHGHAHDACRGGGGRDAAHGRNMALVHKVQRGGMFLSVMIAVIVFLMVVKPNLGF